MSRYSSRLRRLPPDRLRERLALTPIDGRRVALDGRELLNFSGNDYLGLANHPEVCTVFAEGLSQYGAGARASQFVSGYARPLQDLEQALERYTGRSRALLFSSGYLANLSAVTALCGRRDAIIADRRVHASLIDAAVLSRARLLRYPHQDLRQAARLLGQVGEAARLLISESVFSMDGDITPLPELAQLCEGHAAMLLIDDAHGFGAYGAGHGMLLQAGLDQHQVPLLVGTFGKALGLAGAFVAGPAEVLEQVLQRGRSGMYSTAMMPAQAMAVGRALEICQREDWRRQRLQQCIADFRRAAEQSGLPLTVSESAIQPVPARDSRACVQWSRKLREHGFLVPAIRPPTVPEGSARLRVSLSAVHQQTDVHALVEALVETGSDCMVQGPA